MRPGSLIHRPLFQEPIESKGSMGGTTKTWVKFATLWARIEEKAGTEQTNSDQVMEKIVAVAYIRYNKNISAKMRIIHNNRIYQIETVLNKDGKKINLELPLVEFK